MALKGTATGKDASAAFMKTKMCKFAAVGKCTKGGHCPFAHSALELNELPDLRCTKLCKTMLMYGECNIPGCTFAHGRHQLRVTSTRVTHLGSKSAHGPPPSQVPLPPGLDIAGQVSCSKTGSRVGSSIPEPRTAYSPRQVQPQIGMDVPGGHVFEKEANNVANPALGDPIYVQPRSFLLEGPDSPSRYSQLWSKELGMSAANMPTECLPAHMSSIEWASVIGDHSVSVADAFGSGYETSALFEKFWLSQLLPATSAFYQLPASSASYLATPTESTLCPVSDDSE